MRRTAGPTGPPPAKTPGAPRVGATGASGATEQMAAASAAAGESCSAEARRRREPDCCPPVEPNHNPRIESETAQQEAGTPPERKTVTSSPSIPASHELLLFFLDYVPEDA